MIRHPKGRRLLELRDPQREALQNFAAGGNWLTLKARQIGWSTITTTYAFWQAFLHDDQRVLLISKGEREARELLEMMKFGYERLPDWVKARGPKETSRTLETLKFSNGSEINSLPSASNPGRGFSGSLVIVDEWAHLPNDEEAWASIEPVADIGGQIIGLSTANGVGNWFHREWVKATRKENSFQTMFYSWRAVPERDDAWYKRKQNDMLPWVLAQEYPCIGADQRVGSDLGILPISELANANACSGGAISAWVPKGRKPVVTITTAGGYRLTCTPDHKIFDGERWVEAQHAEKIALQAPKFAAATHVATLGDMPSVRREVAITETWGEWLGLFMGDGSISNATLSLVGDAKDSDVMERWCKLTFDLFGLTPVIRVVGSNGGGIEARVSSRDLASILDDLGCTKTSGVSHQRMRRVCVPDAIWRSPKHVVRAFLRGLFEADGYTGANEYRVALFSRDEQFIRDVQLLLLGFEIPSRIAINDKQTSTHSYVGRSLEIHGERYGDFHDKIGFIGERKIARRKARPETMHPRMVRSTMTDTVVSVAPADVADVFDLTTTNHWFDAAGMKVHNCSPEEAFLRSGNPVFDLTNLKRFGDGMPAPYHGRLVRLAERAYEFRDERTGVLKLWELPKEGNVYVIGADVAEGLEHGDASSAHVIDVRSGNMVAHWHGRYDPDLFGEELFALGIFFYGALLGVEANNHGISVTSTLRRMSYPRLWRRREIGTTTSTISTRYGFSTNKQTKPLIIDDLAKSLRENLEIPCADTLAEIRSFVRDGNGKMSGSPFDDRVMSLAIANHMREFAYAPEYAPKVSNAGTLEWWAQQGEPEATTFVIGSHNVRPNRRVSASR